VDPKDTARLARELGRVATDASLRKRLSADGLKQAQKFLWTDAALKTLEVYASAIAQAQARGKGSGRLPRNPSGAAV
jgi:hypothetical protein